MNRYLLSFSYIGTRFKTFAKNVRKGDEVDCTSVVGALEIALRSLNPVNSVKLYTSSRTDAGVHALRSTVHVDLHRRNGQPFDSDHVVGSLNKFIAKAGLDLTVHGLEIVPPQFDAKYKASSRTYLYRLAVCRTQLGKGKLNKQFPINSLSIPIEEVDRCYFRIAEEFDMEKAKAVATLLVGRHDFRTFMSTNNELKTKRPSFALRRINSIDIVPGKPLVVHCDKRPNDDFEYWDVRITAKSFVYRQIRRMIGTLIAAAEGKVTPTNVYEMLTIPSKHSWLSAVKVAPPHGLYLTCVEYPSIELVSSAVSDESETKQN